MLYVRLSEGLTKYKLIPETEDLWQHISSNEKDHYVSLFKYNEEGYQQWKSKGTVAGIKDVTTNKLFFDFDDATNPENAKQDAITVISRLLSAGIKSDNIQIAFSGGKGFSVEVDTTSKFTQEEFKTITFALASDLKTFDTVVNDSQRIIRVVGTRHPKSKLYKMPLTLNQLSELPIEEIRRQAADINNIDTEIMESWLEEIELPEAIKALKIKPKKEEKVRKMEVTDLDLSLKPKWLSEAKFALQMGHFGSGERNTAFMILASTYKGQGFPKEVVYRQLKGVAEIQAERNSSERYSDKELWNNVVEVIFKPDWKGGTYSYENTPLLQEVTKRLGLKAPTDVERAVVPIENIGSIFKNFAVNIDKNTIKLGIESIDSEVTVTTSMLVNLLASPGAGKTSVSLSILNSNSNRGINSIFFSFDMGAPLVFQRLIQKHTGLSGKAIFDLYKNDDPKIKNFESIVAKEYKNVKFCFRSGYTVENIKQAIIEENEKLGTDKIKFVVIDYLENIIGPFSDSTANTAIIAQQLKDLANELEICVWLLVQPQKKVGDPSDEILSYRSIKGSSSVEQAASIIFTMWRPGYSPKSPKDDRYMTIATVKNRMGQLGSFDFAFDGLRGDISELDEMDVDELEKVRQKRAAEKLALRDDI